MRQEQIKCACGCGDTLDRYDNRGRERKFIHNHHARLQEKPGKIMICQFCGKEFYKSRWWIKRVKNHFCSHECAGKWATEKGTKKGKNNGHYNTITVKCAGGCGNDVSRAKSLIQRRNGNAYCKQCKHLTRKGKRGFYVGYPPEFSDTLRQKIRRRDNQTCQLCGMTNEEAGTLHIHHIDYDKDNNAANNLISLCRTCHSKTNFGSRKKWGAKLTSILDR